MSTYLNQIRDLVFCWVMGVFFSLLLISGAWADTLVLTNGKTVEGFVKSEDEEAIELELPYGAAKYRLVDVVRVERSDEEGSKDLRARWERGKEERKKKDAEWRKKEAAKEYLPKEAGLYSHEGHVFVQATIDGQVPARLLLDTGASIVILSPGMAAKLSLPPAQTGDIRKIKVADGREVEARFVRLGSLRVQDVEAKDVEAAILTGSAGATEYEDGLLGMSFLKRFNFQIDYEAKKLTLRKLK